MQLIKFLKRIYGENKFVFHVIADGLFVMNSKCSQGLADMLKKKLKSIQIALVYRYWFWLKLKNRETQK